LINPRSRRGAYKENTTISLGLMHMLIISEIIKNCPYFPLLLLFITCSLKQITTLFNFKVGEGGQGDEVRHLIDYT